MLITASIFLTGHRAGSAARAFRKDGTNVKENRGGARRRNIAKQLASMEGKWIHPDALGGPNIKIQRSLLAAGIQPNDGAHVVVQGDDE